MGRACRAALPAQQLVLGAVPVLCCLSGTPRSSLDGTVGFTVGSGVTEAFMCKHPKSGVWDSSSQCSKLQSVIDQGLTLDNLFNVSGVMEELHKLQELYKCPHHSHE